MLSPGALLFFIVLLVAGFLLEPVAERLRVPISVLLVILGYAGSEFVTTGLGLDTGIRWHNFDRLIFFVFLPILVFNTALHADVRALWRDAFLIFLLAMPLIAAFIGVTAALLYFGIAHPTGFPWGIALLAGAILCATDPAPVIALLDKAGAPSRLLSLLEGESLFNDAASVVLFMLLLGLTMPGVRSVSWGDAGLELARLFLGGTTVGLTVGGAALLIVGRTQQAELVAFVTLACAYGSYVLAESVLHVSGVMAVLCAGLALASDPRVACRGGGDTGFVAQLWSFAGCISGYSIFLLAGVTITLEMFTRQWLAILIGISAVLAARAVIVFGALGPLSRLPGLSTVPASHQAVLVWGATRGTFALALALSLPPSLPGWYTVQSMVYGVVIFSLFVQATTMDPMIRLLKLRG